LVLGLATAPVLARLKTFDAADLTNFRLGPEHAQWLVGPIAHLATEAERRQYLDLTEDSAAEAFIEAFWAHRGPNLVFPPTGPKYVFEERAIEADRVFSEGTFLGRRTDRGTVFILYGSPQSVEHASSPTRFGPPIEIWNYPKKAENGLDGRRPDRSYGFRMQDSVTRFFPLAGVKRLRRTPARNGDLE
jgi:GWxTD domain-containing protein